MEDKNLYINYKTLDISTKGLKEHFHNGYEMIFITEGSSSFTIDNKKHTYNKGDLLFLNNLQRHTMDVVDYPYSRYMLIIDDNYLDSVIQEREVLSIFKSRTDNVRNRFSIKPEHLNFVNDILNEISHAFEFKKDFWQIEFISMFSKLLVFLYREYKDHFPTVNKDKNFKLILEVQQFIDKNFRKDITLDLLAESFFISKYYLSHKYKEITGFTIKQYILLKQISYAKNRLYYTEESITHIALQSGFNSQSNFIRIFSKKEGMTPFKFRKYHRAE